MKTEKSTEEELERFRQIVSFMEKDSENGFKIFYEAYGKFIFHTARLYVRDEFTLTEVVNEVLIRIWNNRKRLKGIDSPKSWIYVITVNCAKRKLRTKNRYVALEETVVDKRDGIQEFIDRDSFYFMIKDLSEIEQQIVLHKCALQFTFKEIGQIMKRGTSTISNIYYRALEKIEPKLEKTQKDA